MRNSLIAVILLFLNITCLTVDPPRPVELKAPTDITVTINEYDSINNMPGEFVRISWMKNYLDTISTASYTILSYTDSSGTPGKITNIPTTISSYFIPVNESYTKEYREKERFIAYTVFGVDTLGRAGDTAALCTVNLAPSVLQSIPGQSIADTTTSINFKWFVRKVPDQTFSHVTLWQDNIELWTSSPESLYTGGEDMTSVTRSLPDSLIPLKEGLYHWTVSLTIVNGRNEPKSFTIKELNVLKE